jgi:hypothetical protein
MIYPYCYYYDERVGCYSFVDALLCVASFAALAIHAAACDASKV